jgi:hypothetical protein
MAVAALSSNTVKTPAQSFEPEPKLSPPAPRRFTRGTAVPLGLMIEMIKSPVKV